MQELFKVRPGEQLSSGIFPGLDGIEPILWADGENVIFDQGKVRKAQGLLGLTDLSHRPRGARAAQKLAGRVLYLGGGASYYRYSSGAGLETLYSSLSGDGNFIFVPYGEHLVVSNGVAADGLRYYDSADSAITTPFTYCQTLFPFRQQVFAAGTSNGLNWIEWCDIDDAKTGWTPTLYNAAGNLQPRDLPGGFVAAHPLGGDVIGLYTESNLGHFSYVGGTLQYGYRPKVDGAGAVSHYAVVPRGALHYVIMFGRAYVTDGVTFDFIDDPAVRTYFDENVDWSRASEVFGWDDRLNSTIRWVLPLTAGGSIGVGYRYDSRRWTKFNDDVLLGVGSGVWPDAMLMKEDRLLRIDQTSANNDLSALTSFIQTKPLDCGNSETYKHLDKIVLDLTYSGVVNLQVAYLDDPLDTPVFDGPTYVATGGDNWMDIDEEDGREGLYVVMKLSTSAEDATWKLGKFEFHGEAGGLRN